MALIKCNECGHTISDKAESCPNCGCPNNVNIESSINRQGNSVSSKKQSGENKKHFIILAVFIIFIGIFLVYNFNVKEENSFNNAEGMQETIEEKEQQGSNHIDIEESSVDTQYFTDGNGQRWPIKYIKQYWKGQGNTNATLSNPSQYRNKNSYNKDWLNIFGIPNTEQAKQLYEECYDIYIDAFDKALEFRNTNAY